MKASPLASITFPREVGTNPSQYPAYSWVLSRNASIWFGYVCPEPATAKRTRSAGS